MTHCAPVTLRTRLRVGLAVMTAFVALAFAPPEAQVDRTRDLYEALRDGQASATIRGMGASSGSSVIVDVAKGPRAGAGAVQLRVPIGTMLRNGGAGQNMVVARVLGRLQGEVGSSLRYLPATVMVVASASPVAYVLEAYCAEFEKENPSANERFTVEGPDRTLAAILQSAQALPVLAKQAAVWMHTDGISQADMKGKFEKEFESADWARAELSYRSGLAAAARPTAPAAPVTAALPARPTPPTLGNPGVPTAARVIPGGSSPQAPMTNADVVSLVKAGLSPTVILLALQKQGGTFDTSPTALIALKQQGVPEQVITAMLNMPAAVRLPSLRGDVRDPEIQWAYIPAGTFQRGCSGRQLCDEDQSPRQSVTLSKAFEMMATEVTLGMWHRSDVPGPAQPDWNVVGSRQPVVNVAWEDARAACSALGGRLPTEAEWEYAARGGIAGAEFPWGNDEPVHTPGARNGAAFGEFSLQPGSTNILARTGGPPNAIAVATFGANGFGLYDMAGNVWEWVSDWYGPYPSGALVDPTGPVSGERRVLRGGSWYDDPWNLRASNRFYYLPSNRIDDDGVRCARDL